MSSGKGPHQPVAALVKQRPSRNTAKGTNRHFLKSQQAAKQSPGHVIANGSSPDPSETFDAINLIMYGADAGADSLSAIADWRGSGCID
jgi:hypothetical protein